VQPDGYGPHMVLEGLAVRLGSTMVGSTAVGWGDAAATYRIEMSDGRVLAARRLDGPTASATAHQRAAVMIRLASEGLPVPHPTVVGSEDGTWLVTPWIDGNTGAAWLDTPERARTLAEGMGRMARHLRTVDPDELELDRTTATSQGLAERARAWLSGVEVDLRAPTTAALVETIGWLSAESRWTPGFVHGDFAPINVIVDAACGVVALLDIEQASLGSPLADIAWWGWVVRHHHPEAWNASWATFRGTAGVDAEPGGPTDVGLRATMLVRLLKAVVEAGDPAARARWSSRLDAAAAW
jgi:aminoglycoside phosphotransferase (APT) family kinase protein